MSANGKKKRVVTALIKHETNGFNRLRTTLADFADQGMALGHAIIERHRGTGTEIGGFIASAESCGWDLVPSVEAYATPSGIVADVAFETIVSELLETLRKSAPVDAVLLALHGSMVTETHEDAEGEILARVRAVVGDDVPVAATLDCHANVTADMARFANALVAFRTSPHTDQALTALRAGRILDMTLRGHVSPSVVIARRPMLIGFDGARTYHEHGPMVDAIRRAIEMERERGVLCVSIHSGYSRSDCSAVGPSVAVTGDGHDPRYLSFAEALMDDCWMHREECSEPVVSMEKAREAALAWRPGDRPVVLGDYGDAPGGGAYGDGTLLLRMLLDNDIANAVVASIWDPQTARQAVAAGPGARIIVSLGGRHDPCRSGLPVDADAEVLSVSDGHFTLTGSYARGMLGTFGPSAAIRIQGVTVIVSSVNKGVYDLGQLRMFGIEPTEKSVLVIKSMQGHRAAFEPIASRCLDVDTGGLTSNNPQLFNWTRISRPVWPLDPVVALRA